MGFVRKHGWCDGWGLLGNTDGAQIVSFAGSVWLSIITQQKYFLASDLSSTDTAILVCSSPLKSRKWSAHDIIDTCATHASLVHDVTYTDCQTRNGSTYGCFCNFLTLIFDKLDQKLTEKLL